eukprot:GILK01006197.1.p1 GENE.GILK01006197.1~~GILK01006197.1.p1  ORF type:complete len:895 (+),score=191.54 GILK01006197.1:113-2797(+)
MFSVANDANYDDFRHQHSTATQRMQNASAEVPTSPELLNAQLRFNIAEADSSVVSNLISEDDLSALAEGVDVQKFLAAMNAHGGHLDSDIFQPLPYNRSISTAPRVQQGQNDLDIPSFRRLESYVGTNDGFNLFAADLDRVGVHLREEASPQYPPSTITSPPSEYGTEYDQDEDEPPLVPPPSMNEMQINAYVNSIPYQDGLELPLGEAGREMLRAILRERLDRLDEAKKAKHHGRLMRDSRNATLLKMAHDCGVWTEAVRIHLEQRGVLPMSERHREMKELKKLQSLNRRNNKIQKQQKSPPVVPNSPFTYHDSMHPLPPAQASASASASYSFATDNGPSHQYVSSHPSPSAVPNVSTPPLSSSVPPTPAQANPSSPPVSLAVAYNIHYQPGTSLRLGGVGRELLKKKISEALKKKEFEAVKHRLEREGTYTGSLRKSTIPELLRMAFSCGLWEYVVRIHLEFTGQLAPSDEYQSKKTVMVEKEKTKHAQSLASFSALTPAAAAMTSNMPTTGAGQQMYVPNYQMPAWNPNVTTVPAPAFNFVDPRAFSHPYAAQQQHMATQHGMTPSIYTPFVANQQPQQPPQQQQQQQSSPVSLSLPGFNGFSGFDGFEDVQVGYEVKDEHSYSADGCVTLPNFFPDSSPANHTSFGGGLDFDFTPRTAAQLVWDYRGDDDMVFRSLPSAGNKKFNGRPVYNQYDDDYPYIPLPQEKRKQASSSSSRQQQRQPRAEHNAVAESLQALRRTRQERTDEEDVSVSVSVSHQSTSTSTKKREKQPVLRTESREGSTQTIQPPQQHQQQQQNKMQALEVPQLPKLYKYHSDQPQRMTKAVPLAPQLVRQRSDSDARKTKFNSMRIGNFEIGQDKATALKAMKANIARAVEDLMTDFDRVSVRENS